VDQNPSHYCCGQGQGFTTKEKSFFDEAFFLFYFFTVDKVPSRIRIVALQLTEFQA
jgi:hypothetical protein